MSRELQQFCFSQVGLHAPENLENTIFGEKQNCFPQELCTKKSLQGFGHVSLPRLRLSLPRKPGHLPFPAFSCLTVSGSTPTPWSGWHGPRPWSESPSEHRNPRNKGFSGSGAPIFGFGLEGKPRELPMILFPCRNHRNPGSLCPESQKHTK